MKKHCTVFLIILILSLAAVLSAWSKKSYQPTEKIPADTAVSFPVDI